MAGSPRIHHAGDVEMPGLSLEQCGWEACEPGHLYGPAVRDFYLIHHVAHGKGTFRRGKETYTLSEGDGFLILPGETTTYVADIVAPWEYYWVGFSGPAAAWLVERVGLGPQRPVFRIADDPAEAAGRVMDIYTNAAMPGAGALRALGGLLNFMACVAQSTAPRAASAPADTVQAGYVAEAMRYVQAHYADAVTVAELAAHVGIDRSHLYRVFRGCIGVGPQQYLVSVRVQQAARLLSETSMPLHQVAEYAGFSSPTHLGVAFRRAYGLAPGLYRAKARDGLK